MNDYSSPSTVDLCLLVVAKQVANITENSILRESNWPVLFAGGNTAKLSKINTETEVIAAPHLAKVSFRVGGCSALACDK